MQPQDLIAALSAAGITTAAQFTALIQMAQAQMQLNAIKLQIANLATTQTAQTNAINTQRATLQAQANTVEAQITALMTPA